MLRKRAITTFLSRKRAITTFLSRKRAITTFLSQKRAITTFLSRKFMITRLSIAFEDFLGSSIASQVMPPCPHLKVSLSRGNSSQVPIPNDVVPSILLSPTVLDQVWEMQ